MSKEEDQEKYLGVVPEGTILIIFGASGDLTRRKLMPALYHLTREKLLPEKFHVLGLGRRIQLGSEFLHHMKHRVMQYCTHELEELHWDYISSRMSSLRADYQNIETFHEIKTRIKLLSQGWGLEPNLLFYLATSPSHFELIISYLAEVGFNITKKNHWHRVIIEKPFGLDLKSADRLNNVIMEYFNESQIYRIDHFLGKEAVQNILIFRMSNIMFQPLWNREYIEYIQITSAETIGVEGRVDFFEQTGAVRDMIQSHLLQILAFLTMEHPDKLDPEMIRDEKVILLKAIRKYEENSIHDLVVRGQYTEGVVNSEFVPRYTNEVGVNPSSTNETYACLKLFIDNYRWRGVPIYIRTGKRMPNRKMEIIIQLKSIVGSSIPAVLRQQAPVPNTIKLEIQPRAGIDVSIGWKPPGLLTEVEPTSLNIGGKVDINEPKAYERLLVDAMRGDSTLFIRYDEIRAMWKIVDPIIKYWKKEDSIDQGGFESQLHYYSAGAQGPEISKAFIQKDGFQWSEI